MNQFPIPVPKRCPLSTIRHAIVAEDGVHMVDWILESYTWIKWSIQGIQSIRKSQLAEAGVRVGGHDAFKFQLDCQRDKGCGRDGWRVGDRWRGGDGWGKGDGRGLADGRGDRDGRRDRYGCSGGIDPVDQRFNLRRQHQPQNQPDKAPKQKQTPAAHRHFSPHPEKRQCASFSD